MKILQINCVYKQGSTGKITRDLHEYYLQNGNQSYVIYGRGEKSRDKYCYKCAGELGSKFRNVISKFSGNLYGMGKIALHRVISRIKRIHPDVIHLHCINGFFIDIYGLLNYLKKHNIPTVLTLHAEFMYTGNCGYAFECEQWKSGCATCPNVLLAITSKNKKAPKRNWGKMQCAFQGFDNLSVIGVSDWVSDRAKQSAILQDKYISTVFNGLDDTIFTYMEDALYPQVEKARENEEKILLFVSPHFESENKGGAYIIELAKALQSEKVRIIVVSKAGQTYDLPNITFVGMIKNQSELAKWYSQADVTLLTSKQETFSMICAESLCCGTPIVGFKAGAPERISIAEYSQFVEYGNVSSLKEAVLSWLGKEIDKKRISTMAREQYSKNNMARKYLAEYQKLLDRKETEWKK